MNQLEDSIETVDLYGSFDITDMIQVVIFGVYAYFSIRSSKDAFIWANDQYKKNRTKKNYNLFSLIFEDSDFTIQ